MYRQRKFIAILVAAVAFGLNGCSGSAEKVASMVVDPSPSAVVSPVSYGEWAVVDWYGWPIELTCCGESRVLLHPKGWNPRGVGALQLIPSSPEMGTRIASAIVSESTAHVWGKVRCELPDYGDCVLTVSRLRLDEEALPASEDVVEAWQGFLVETPELAEPGIYFVLDGPFPARYRVSRDSKVDQSQLDILRRQANSLRVWGFLRSQVGSQNGAELVIDRLQETG